MKTTCSSGRGSKQGRDARAAADKQIEMALMAYALTSGGAFGASMDLSWYYFDNYDSWASYREDFEYEQSDLRQSGALREDVPLAAAAGGTQVAIRAMAQSVAQASRQQLLAVVRSFWRGVNKRTWRFPSLVLLIVTLAELLSIISIISAPRLGMLLHISTIFLLFHSLLHTTDRLVSRLQSVLLLVPLMRVISLGLPLAIWPQSSWYFAVSVPLFVAIMLITQNEQVSWSREEQGLTGNHLLLQLLAAPIVGLGLGWLQYQILTPDPLTTELTWQAIWLPALILMICTGYLEEWLFRGLLQSAAISVIGRWPGLLFVATLFAVLHMGYASALNVLLVFAVGLAFGLVTLHTRSIIGVTLAHGITNISLFLLWPFWL